MLSTNMTLMLRPEVWRDMYSASALGAYLPTGDPTLEPRWLLMMAGGLFIGGLWLVYLAGRSTFTADEKHFVAGLGGRDCCGLRPCLPGGGNLGRTGAAGRCESRIVDASSVSLRWLCRIWMDGAGCGRGPCRCGWLVSGESASNLAWLGCCDPGAADRTHAGRFIAMGCGIFRCWRRAMTCGTGRW